MPKLVPFGNVRVPNSKPANERRKPVHERLGRRPNAVVDSECESIHTSRLALYSKPVFKPHNINNRLKANFVNSAQIQRNKITFTTLQKFCTYGLRNLGATDQQHGQFLAEAVSVPYQAIENGNEQRFAPIGMSTKYDMEVQEEICQLQVSVF